MVDLPLPQVVSVMQALHASGMRNVVVVVKAQTILLIFFILRLNCEGFGTLSNYN